MNKTLLRSILPNLILFALIILGVFAYGETQYQRGMKTERTVWIERENEVLTKANNEITRIHQEARERERKHAEDIALISAQYQEELRRVELKKDRVIADLRAGDQRLFIPVAGGSAACSGIPPEAFAAAGGRDDAPRAELSEEAAEFLVGLASEADEVVHQLTACQQILLEDRK